MNYEVKPLDKEKVPFDDLKTGDYYYHNNTLYRKTEQPGSATEMSTGREWWISGVIKVTKVEQTNTIFFE